MKRYLEFVALAAFFVALGVGVQGVRGAQKAQDTKGARNTQDAQIASQFSFTTKAYEAMNRWVVFPPSSGPDPRYLYGFVYTDLKAGFTFRIESTFKIENGKLVAQRKGDVIEGLSRFRINPGTRDVAILTPEQVAQLGLPVEPEWLRIYEPPTETGVEYLKDMGYCYNAAGVYEKALEYLRPAYEQQPHYKGLEYELAFAYNALKRFDEAIAVADSAIANTPDDPMLYRELGYALKWKGDMEDAEKACRTGIEKSSSNEMRAEMAVNMAHGYFMVRNRDKYRQWVVETAKYATPGSQQMRHIDAFNSEWDKPDTVKLPPAGTIPGPQAPAAVVTSEAPTIPAPPETQSGN